MWADDNQSASLSILVWPLKETRSRVTSCIDDTEPPLLHLHLSFHFTSTSRQARGLGQKVSKASIVSSMSGKGYPGKWSGL